MALADAIYSKHQKPIAEVRINGVLLLNVAALYGGSSIDLDGDPVPYCDIHMPRDGLVVPTRGSRVTVDVGYEVDGVRMLARKFTGGYYAIDDEDPDRLRTQCFAAGRDENGNALEATASVISHPPIWPAIPDGQFVDFAIDNHLAWTADKVQEMALRELAREARIPNPPTGDPATAVLHCLGDLKGAYRTYSIPGRDVSGLNVSTAIRNVLSDSGVGSMNVYDSDYDLAPTGALLTRQPGSSMLNKYLFPLDGVRVQQLPSGLVIVRVIEEQPAATPRFIYSEADLDYAVIVDETGALEVPLNPLAVPGETHRLELATLGKIGNFWMHTEEWEITPDGGAWSRFQYAGGEDFGTSLGVNPVASFTYSVLVEVMGSEPFVVVTVIDTSTDPDGSIDQAASTWASNQTTIPPISDFNGEPTATVRIALGDIVGDFTITRTVQDDDGLPDDYTETIDTATPSIARIPTFYVAAGIRRMASRDGGLSFNDTTPSGGALATVVGARAADGVNSGHAVYGEDGGTLHLTTDFNATVVEELAAIGEDWVDCQWDWRDQSLVWALSTTGKIYVSNTYGTDFFLLADLRTVTYGGFGGTTPAALGGVLGLPAGGGVYVFGGDGVGTPLVVYNSNPFGIGNVWMRRIFLGDLLADVPSSDTACRIIDAIAPGYGGETIILDNTGDLTPIYHTNDAPAVAMSYTRATGLDGGLTEGRVIMESGPLSPVARIAFFNNRDRWAAADGIAYVKTADVLPAGFTPNHGLFVAGPGGYADVYEHVLALEDATGTGRVVKSTDECVTVQDLRPGVVTWPAGAKAKRISVGAPAVTDALINLKLAALLTNVNPTKITKLLMPDPTWTAPITIGNDGEHALLSCASPLDFYMVEDADFASDVDKLSRKSHDAGATWAADDLSTVGVTRDAGGRFWRIRRFNNPWHQTAIEWSDDGDTWATSLTYGNGTNQQREGVRIAAHPLNQNVIAVWGATGGSGGFIASTASRGGSWDIYEGGSRPPHGQAGVCYTFHFTILESGRFMWVGFTAAGPNAIKRSDDGGENWVDVFTDSSVADRWLCLEGYAGKVVAFRDRNNQSDHGIPLVSRDGGTTIAELAIPDFRTTLGIAESCDSAAYHGASDTLVIFPDNNRVYAFTPVATDGVWSDITDSLGAGAGGSHGHHALTVIP